MKSDRGIDLYLEKHPDPRSNPIITVERWCKWYTFYVVHTDKIEGMDEQEGYNIVQNHLIDPSELVRFAKDKGYSIDDESFEVIVGRWNLEKLEQDYGQ